MYRALIGLFLCAVPALAQSPGYFRPTDGIVLTRDQQRALLARVYEAYRNLPDDLTFVNDELRVARAVRPANGEWVVVEMSLDGRRLPLSEFDGLSYEFEEGVFQYLDSPVTRAVPPFALREWRTPEAESVFTPLREAILQNYGGEYWDGLRDYEAIRPQMLYAGAGRLRLWWWDRFGESLDPAVLYRDPDTLVSIPELQWAIPTEGTMIVTPTQLRLGVRGVGLRSLLPPKFQGPLGSDRAVVLVMEREPRRPFTPLPPLTTPPDRRRLAMNDRPATDRAIVRHTVVPEPKRLVFDTTPSPGPTRIVFLPEQPATSQVVRGR